MLAVYMVAMDIIAKYKIVAEGERLPPCGRERLPPPAEGERLPPLRKGAWRYLCGCGGSLVERAFGVCARGRNVVFRVDSPKKMDRTLDCLGKNMLL